MFGIQVAFGSGFLARGVVSEAKAKPKTKAGKRKKVEASMHEFKHGKLHSGSKHGPVVKNKKQAVAIALSQAGMSKKK